MNDKGNSLSSAIPVRRNDMRAIMMRRIVGVVVGTSLIGFFVWPQRLAGEAPAVETLVAREAPSAAQLAIKLEPPVDDSFAASAKSDPVGAFRDGLARYEARVHDYTCTFEKQERVGGQLTAKQVTHIRFRERPFSDRHNDRGASIAEHRSAHSQLRGCVRHCPVGIDHQEHVP
jgi:hypothetical protein